MSNFTRQSTLKSIFEMSKYEEIQRYLLYSPVLKMDQDERFRHMSVGELSRIGWKPEGIIRGLDFLDKQIEACRFELHFMYKEERCTDDTMKKDVNVMYFKPEKQGNAEPYIILAAGGGYQNVCTMVETLPTARYFTEAGYPVFLLTYRVSAGNTVEKALDDLAEALRYIKKEREYFGVNPDHYAIGGFSAGGHLISCWGVPDIGYRKYGIVKPEALFPVYALLNLEQEKNVTNRESLLDVMFEKATDENIRKYDVLSRIDGNYPSCYIVCGKDDTTVPPENSELLKQLLDQAGVRSVLEEGEHAQHGFGDGTDTDVSGWPIRAIEFLRRQSPVSVFRERTM